MSFPQSILDISIAEKASSAPNLHVLIGGDGRARAVGSRGAFVVGGPTVEGMQLKSVPVVAGNLHPSQLVGGYVGFADNAGASATVTLPSPAALFEYLSRQQFRAEGDPAPNVAATTDLATPSVPVETFRCTFVTGTGNAPSLALNGLEYYPNGAANPPIAGPVDLPPSAVIEFVFFPIQAASVAAPRIGILLDNVIGTPSGNGGDGTIILEQGLAGAVGTNQVVAGGAAARLNLDSTDFDTIGVVDLANNQLSLPVNSAWVVTANLVGVETGNHSPNTTLFATLYHDNNGNVTPLAYKVCPWGPTDEIFTADMSTVVQTGPTGNQYVYVVLQNNVTTGANRDVTVSDFRLRAARNTRGF